MNAGFNTSTTTSDIRISVSFSMPFAALTKCISASSSGIICETTGLYTCDGTAMITILAPCRTSFIVLLTCTDSGTRADGR